MAPQQELYGVFGPKEDHQEAILSIFIQDMGSIHCVLSARFWPKNPLNLVLFNKMAFSCCLKHPLKLLHVSTGSARNKHKFLKGSQTANSGFHHILSLETASGNNTNSTFSCICFELLGKGAGKLKGRAEGSHKEKTNVERMNE